MSDDPTKIKLQTNVKQERDPTLVRMRGRTAHKSMEFDVPFMTEIQPGLWQGGCQKGLELPHFIKNVVSLYPWEQYTIKHDLESYFTVKMFDALAQSTKQVDVLAQWVNVCLMNQQTILVHCQAGLNRSSLIVARALVKQGYSPDEAINILRTKRSPAALCNQSFEDFIRGAA